MGRTDNLAKVSMSKLGYSGTPLAKKLGIKEGMTVVAVNAPEDYAELLDPLPEDVKITNKPLKETDILHLFTNSREGLFGGLDGKAKPFRTSRAEPGDFWRNGKVELFRK